MKTEEEEYKKLVKKAEAELSKSGRWIDMARLDGALRSAELDMRRGQDFKAVVELAATLERVR